MDLRRSERIPDRVTFLLIELPVDAGRRGYMDCVPINIVVVNSQPAEVLMERLVSWLRANGAQLDKLALVWCIALGLEVPRWT